MKALAALLLLLLQSSPLLAQSSSDAAHAKLIQGKFVHAEEPLVKNGLPLWLYADKKIARGDDTYPLLICLHGRRNNAKPGEPFKPQNIAIPWTKSDVQRKNPCIVVQPYYPPKGGWEKIPEQLDDTIADLIKNLPVDPERVYLLGFSNGAQGTFQTLARQPKLYAGAITIAGPVSPKSVVGKIKAPIRAWVGENDHDLNKNTRTVALAEALKEDGLDIEVTVVKGAGHSCHHVPIGDPKVRDWLFSQRR